MNLEPALRAARAAGRKVLLPYMTGDFSPDWLDMVGAMAAAGADAIEIGIPFSDPVMDGPTIQQASERALARGATPVSILQHLRGHDVPVPLVAMTYYNIVFHAGHQRFAALLREAGVDGAIIPDAPLEEIGPWAVAADAAGVETVLLAAPTGDDDRLARICARSRGFVYAVSLVGVTGERGALADTAKVMAKRLKEITDKPVVVGIGISTAAQAVEVCEEADGVVMASALLRRLLDGGGPEHAAEFVTEVRAALDRG
jgi:tryptophan synthase alpha chain